MKVIRIENPITLWTPLRIDISAKILFIKYLEENIDSLYGEDVYLNHLRVWNGLREIEPPKKGAYDYLDSFRKIIKDVKTDEFDFKKNPILFNTNNNLINGSHRLAAAIYFNKPVYVKYTDNLEGQEDCNYELFRAHNSVHGRIEKGYLDSMVLEYIKRKAENVFVITIFPSAKGLDEKIENTIKDYASIIYRKDFLISKVNAEKFIDVLYHGEDWLNGGISAKASFTFPESGYVRTFFIEVSDSKILTELKERLRGYWDLGKHSLHINDTRTETLRISRNVLNDNSLRFINTEFLGEPKLQSLKLFEDFLEELQQKGVNKEKVLVDGSFVLSLYQIREVGDIDFISKGDIGLSNKFQSHNKYIQKFGFRLDDWLFNPQKYFYYKDVKVLTLEEALVFKRRRLEEKDKNDISKLEEVYPKSSGVVRLPLDSSEYAESYDRTLSRITQTLEQLEEMERKNKEDLLFVKDICHKILLRSSIKWWVQRIFSKIKNILLIDREKSKRS